MTYYEEIGDRIRQRREQLGMTQEELGIAMGFNPNSAKTSISKYEKGDTKSLDVGLIAKIASYLHCDPRWLTQWEDGQVIVEPHVVDKFINVVHENPNVLPLVEKASKLSDKDLQRFLKMLSLFMNGDE